MEWKKIVAIIRRDKLRDVEERLKDLRVNGISVTRGKGYGGVCKLFFIGLVRDACPARNIL